MIVGNSRNGPGGGGGVSQSIETNIMTVYVQGLQKLEPASSPSVQRTRVNGHKVQWGKFCLGIMKRLFTRRMFGYENKPQGGSAPGVGASQAWLAKALSTVSSHGAGLSEQEERHPQVSPVRAAQRVCNTRHKRGLGDSRQQSCWRSEGCRITSWKWVNKVTLWQKRENIPGFTISSLTSNTCDVTPPLCAEQIGFQLERATFRNRVK